MDHREASSNDLPLGGSGLTYVRGINLLNYDDTDRNMAFGFRVIGLSNGNLLSYIDSSGTTTPLLTFSLLGTQINAVNSAGTVIPIGPVLTQGDITQITGIIRPADGTTDRFASDPMHMWISINGETPIITQIAPDSNVLPSSNIIMFGRNSGASRVGALQFAIFNPPVPASASELLTAHAIDNLNVSYERNMFGYIAAGGAEREKLNITGLTEIEVNGEPLNTGGGGERGPIGPQGVPGADGSDGATGPRGLQGAQGPTGQDGNDGSTGPRGEQGEQGIQGPMGEQGDTGTQGSPGQDGAGVEAIPADFVYTLVGSGDAVVTSGRIAVDTGITGWDTYTKIAINFGASSMGGTIGASRELETRLLLALPASVVGQSQATDPDHFIRLGGDAGDGGQALIGRTADNSLLFTSNNGIDVLPLEVYGVTIIGVASSGERGPMGLQGSDGATGPRGIQGGQGEDGAAGPISTTSIVRIGEPVNLDLTVSNRFISTGLIVPADAKWGRISLEGISDRRLPAYVLDFDIFRALPESIADTGGSNFVNSTTTIIIDTFSFNTFSLGRGANNELLFAASVATIDPMPLTLYRENTTDVTPGQDGSDGADGAAGPQGVPGTDGNDGARGPQGIQGNTGQDGSDGSDGSRGAQGAAGMDGVAGPQGPASTTSVVQVGQPANLSIDANLRFYATGLIVPNGVRWGRITFGMIPQSNHTYPTFTLNFDSFRALPQSGTTIFQSVTTGQSIVFYLFEGPSSRPLYVGRGPGNQLLIATENIPFLGLPIEITLYRENTTDVAPAAGGLVRQVISNLDLTVARGALTTSITQLPYQATITPRSSDARIRIEFTNMTSHLNDPIDPLSRPVSEIVNGRIWLLRNGQSVVQLRVVTNINQGPDNNIADAFGLLFIDAPNTTSPITYSLGIMRGTQGETGSRYGFNSSQSVVTTLTEYGPN